MHQANKKCCKKEKNIKTPQIGVSKTDKNIKNINKKNSTAWFKLFP